LEFTGTGFTDLTMTTTTKVLYCWSPVTTVVTIFMSLFPFCWCVP
jgi:hypothetical protein